MVQSGHSRPRNSLSAIGAKRTTQWFSPAAICRLLTHQRHWVCIAAMVFKPLRCHRLSFEGGHAAARVHHAYRRCGGAWPLAARAQQPTMPVVGFLRSVSARQRAELFTAFREGLKETGFVEGQNVAIEFRSAEDHLDRLPALVADLIRRPVAVIVGNQHFCEGGQGRNRDVTDRLYVRWRPGQGRPCR